MPSVEELIPRVKGWADAKDIKVTFLAGGITNLNYRVDVNGGSYVIRVTGADSELLGINRAHEYDCQSIASETGVAPDVIDFLRPEGILVSKFISGHPIPAPDLRKPENIRRVVSSIKPYHNGRDFPGNFSPFRVVEDYLSTARRYPNTPIPKNMDWLSRKLAEMEEALYGRGLDAKPCHNDLLNANFIDDDRKIWIIDWEYGGMGDIYFDLANLADHHEFTDSDEEFLLKTYFGLATEAMMGQLKLMKIVSEVREAMWGVVQVGISKLDEDFVGYAGKFFARADCNIEDPRYRNWLMSVQT